MKKENGKSLQIKKMSAGIFFSMLLFSFIFIPGCKKMKSENLSVEQVSGVQSFNIKPIDLQLVASNFISPIGVVAVPDNSNRLFVIDQAGMIWIINAAGNTLPTPFMDVVSRMVSLQAAFDERGLLGLAFHPDYSTNGRLFVYYNAPARPGGPAPGISWNNLARISEFHVSASNMNQVDMSSERVLLEFDDPQLNHNGGTLAFGPDGYLYISIGDGGGANDVGPGHVSDWYPVNAGGNGQDLVANYFGNILRIDVNGAQPYAIPQDNPFVGRPGLDEIYAFGFRNPYRMSFDMSGSRKLYAGDAGQLLYEEIDVVVKGGNYGWNVKEGTHCFNAANSLVSLPSCPSVDTMGNPLIDPVIEMRNFRNTVAPGPGTATIIGGNVYRGHTIPGFQGKYIFGSYSRVPTPASGEIFIAQPAGEGLWPIQELSFESFPAGDLGQYIKGFGQNLQGEIYVTTAAVQGPTGNSGKVYKLVAASQ